MLFDTHTGSICWDILFNFVKHRGTTELWLGDDESTYSQFDETNFPQAPEAVEPEEQVLCKLEVIDVENLGSFKGESECDLKLGIAMLIHFLQDPSQAISSTAGSSSASTFEEPS